MIAAPVTRQLWLQILHNFIITVLMEISFELPYGFEKQYFDISVFFIAETNALRRILMNDVINVIDNVDIVII